MNIKSSVSKIVEIGKYPFSLSLSLSPSLSLGLIWRRQFYVLFEVGIGPEY